MKRPWQVWLAFAIAAAVMIGALGWVSSVVLRLDREGMEARRRAALEETVRLALWRMEAVAAPVVAREGARPYFAWQSFYPAGRAYTRMFARLESGDVLVPSPLLADTGEYVALHFQIGPDGRLTSPQVPEGNMRDIAESGYLEHGRVDEGATRLARLSVASLVREKQRLPVVVSTPVRTGGREPARPSEGRPLSSDAGGAAQPAALLQQQLNTNESIARLRAVQQASGTSLSTPPTDAGEVEVVQGAMVPVWMGQDLVLLRRVLVGQEEYLQGCLLVWPELGKVLIESVRDILPGARLEAVAATSGDGQDDPRRLAALPVRLEPGALPVPGAGEVSTTALTLTIAWGALLTALVAAGLVLASAVSLGERRNAFVSAVTHELRTPLTTFRMYTEMLDDGMVPDEEKRRSYVSLLRSEAERLGHLVENVLAYSRLERLRAHGRSESLGLGGLVGSLLPRLERRAAEVRLELRFEASTASPDRVRADRDAVERILFNLVDNACKYASHGSMPVLELRVAGNCVSLRDFGPGIPAETARKLFRPFSRGAQEAAGGPPGVGLGLALSRRLAQRMGGDLVVSMNGPDGAEFRLTLPLE